MAIDAVKSSAATNNTTAEVLVNLYGISKHDNTAEDYAVKSVCNAVTL